MVRFRTSQRWKRCFVDNTICYLNTDLDLSSTADLTELVDSLQSAGVRALHGVTHSDDGLWYALFETKEQRTDPESSIAHMLVAIESLSGPLRAIWDGCKLREFNIGYDCGEKPWAFNQGLSAAVLGRMSAAGASLRITMYPDRDLPAPAKTQSRPKTRKRRS